jgi:two-component system NtrC family response regulator
VADGQFREDLYFRLAVVVIKLPPLRERDEDVIVLAKEFLNRFSVESERPNMSFAPSALRALAAHQWPGNVRELQNRVRRAVIMTDGKRIRAVDLELTDSVPGRSNLTLKEAREAVEKEVVENALKRHLGRISSAAAELGISRPTLYETMDRLGIARREAKKEE